KSKMNGFKIDGICGSSEPDPTSGEPTPGDAAAVEELFASQALQWSPFRPIGRSVSLGQPLDYQLAPGVDSIGTPAIAAWTSPAVEVFVRGTGNFVYGTHNELASGAFLRWSDWQLVALGVDASPAIA